MGKRKREGHSEDLNRSGARSAKTYHWILATVACTVQGGGVIAD